MEIMFRRLREAATAIADFCGFGTDRELRWLFRKRTGKSLRQWRAQRMK